MSPLRFSVVIPTYQRRNVVLRSVRSLVCQEFDGTFEVIVVVDGSQDGSGHALRELDLPFPLTVLEQPNQGASSARNRGATAARGEILLFLDDDMEADPRLLSEHDRSHREGVDVVIGHIPLHPESPCSILSRGVKTWADTRLERLCAPGAVLTLHDLLTGQLSLARKTFDSVGRFDTHFTYGGSFGGEDIDLGYRLLLAGYKIVFNPNAVSWHYYIVEPRQYLRQWRQAGGADVAFARKHPEQAKTIFFLNGAERRINRYVWRPLLALPLLNALVPAILRRLALTLVDHRGQGSLTCKLFYTAKRVEYWRAVRDASDMPGRRTVRVLAYHAIADLNGAPVVDSYAVPPNLFRRQLDTLQQAGFRFLHPDEFFCFLKGHGALPRRALLLTFDDCYQDLLEVVSPILEQRGIPAVAFAVTGQLGGKNTWDEERGAPQLQLLSADGLKKLAARGIEIGVHSRTHRTLTHLSGDELEREIAGSIEDLEKIGLKRPRFFAYPYGESDRRVQQAAHKADLQAAFTVKAGLVRSSQDPYRIPRIEILKGDVGWKFRWKVEMAGTASLLSRRYLSLFQGLWWSSRVKGEVAKYSA